LDEIPTDQSEPTVRQFRTEIRTVVWDIGGPDEKPFEKLAFIIFALRPSVLTKNICLAFNVYAYGNRYNYIESPAGDHPILLTQQHAFGKSPDRIHLRKGAFPISLGRGLVESA